MSTGETDLLPLFVGPLEEAGLDSYLISGSVASIEYGEPRATLDVDLVLILDAGKAGDLVRLFPEPEFYCPPADVVASELARPSRGHFNLIHLATGLKADVYPSRNHPLLAWALNHRRRVSLPGLDAWFAPPEYVILWKLEFHREGAGDKHLRDIRGMLAVSGREIDEALITEWARRLGLTAQWEAARAGP